MSSSRALASQEREQQFVRLGRTAKALLLLLATLMTFATVALLLADRLYRPDAFVINQLKLKGQFNYVTPQAVQDVVFREPLGNFFSIELGEIKQRVEQMSWVKHADVRREWPHTLIVRVAEHRPILRWQQVDDAASSRSANQGADGSVVEQWVSASGSVISLDQALVKESAMLLRGNEHDAPDMLKSAMKWQRQLAASGIRIAELTLSSSQSWSLTLTHLNQSSRFELLLGRSEVEARLQRFQALFEQQLKQAPKDLVRVDARYPDGVAVHAKERAEEPVQATSVGQIDFKPSAERQPS